MFVVCAVESCMHCLRTFCDASIVALITNTTSLSSAALFVFKSGHIAAAGAVATSPTAPSDGKLMLIGGELVQAEGGRTTEVINPTTGRVFTRVPDASKHDLDRAVGGEFAFKGMTCSDCSPRVFLSSCVRLSSSGP